LCKQKDLVTKPCTLKKEYNFVGNRAIHQKNCEDELDEVRCEGWGAVKVGEKTESVKMCEWDPRLKAREKYAPKPKCGTDYCTDKDKGYCDGGKGVYKDGEKEGKTPTCTYDGHTIDWPWASLDCKELNDRCFCKPGWANASSVRNFTADQDDGPGLKECGKDLCDIRADECHPDNTETAGKFKTPLLNTSRDGGSCGCECKWGWRGPLCDKKDPLQVWYSGGRRHKITGGWWYDREMAKRKIAADRDAQHL